MSDTLQSSNKVSRYSEPEEQEFGGPWGAFAIILGSHALVYYFWVSVTYYQASFVHPSSLSDLLPFIARMGRHVIEGASPTWHAAAIYLGFFAFQLLLATIAPGVWVKGLPVPTEGNVQHRYLCNGAASWYITLALAALLHWTEVFRLTEFADHLGPILTVGVIVADALAIGAYVGTMKWGKPTRLSGNLVYDFFMGAILNPRIGRVDLKFFTEIRVAWMVLFFLTLSAAVKQYEVYGVVSWPMIFMLTAHGLYTNACMKGEECIPTTWDVFHEKWGWMLIFWNLVGVPFVYSFQSYFILKNGPFEHSAAYMVALFVALFCAYYIWDTSQSQKNRFRMQTRGTFVKRYTFPQLPWGTLKNPRFLKTQGGGTLLVDGWWQYARKIHYTADIVMALTWALSCGFKGVLPFFYPAFFIGMILHRAHRDWSRCERKYGKDWDAYCKAVPYKFIPFIY